MGSYFEMMHQNMLEQMGCCRVMYCQPVLELLIDYLFYPFYSNFYVQQKATFNGLLFWKDKSRLIHTFDWPNYWLNPNSGCCFYFEFLSVSPRNCYVLYIHTF